MNWVQLTRAAHAGLRVDPALALSACATVHMVPLTYGEIRRAASDFPVVLAKDAETGQFYPAALLGLEPHENLYWDGARLAAEHVPLNLARLPFGLGGADLAAAVICVDLDSPGIVAEGGAAIVEADGRDSAYLAGVQATLGELAGQVAPTRAFIEAAVQARLVVPIRLDIAFDNGSKAELAGLYAIDEAALLREIAGIDTETAMVLAAMALSIDRIGALVRRKNARLADAAVWFGADA